MKILNATPFPFAPYAGRVNFPGHSMTLIVKGTFDLVHEGVVVPADEQPFPTGDEFYPDDDEGAGSARYESDFAYFKPRADLLLAGTCHPPGGGPARECEVRFKVGRYGKDLIVSGDRHWRGPMGVGGSSDAVPFSRQELRFEKAYGGEGREQNPVGLGHTKTTDENNERVLPLPNIESPDARVTSSMTRPEPAGFGPLGRMWKQRAGFLGTYKNRWLKNRWPWFPEDFDYAHFNAASPGMQVSYLAGDETVQCDNLHPEHESFRTRLPGFRVRCFLDQGESLGVSGDARFHEVEMNLDTLWVDMDAGKLVLVWRGVADVQSNEFEGVEHVYIRPQLLDEEPASLEACRLEFEAARSGAESVPEAEPIPAEEVAPPPVEPPVGAAGEEEDAAAIRAEVSAAALAMLASLGIPMTRLPEQAQRAIDRMTESDPEVVASMDAEEADTRLQENYEQLGLDPDKLPPPTEKARAEQLRILSEIGVEDPSELVSDPASAQLLNTMSALLPMVGLDPEDLSDVIDQIKKLPGEPETPVGGGKAPEPAADDERIRPLTREQVEIDAANNLSFADEDLSGLDLSGLDLSGLDFRRANLSGMLCVEADLTGSNLAGANFEGADASRAIFAGANLSGANLSAATLAATLLADTDLTGGKFPGASLDGADLTAAKLEGADLTGASCSDASFRGASMGEVQASDVTATAASFVEADLTGANLAGGDLSKADFSKAILSGASFASATLVDATIEAVTCIGANFSKADCTRLRASDGSDFSQTNFTEMRADESIWEGANLSEANLSYTKMQAANFLKACLQRANLNAADLPQTRFMGADLGDAQMIEANLFEGSFERADLTRADLSGANLYAVEFLDARMEGTVLRNANLKMSKLA